MNLTTPVLAALLAALAPAPKADVGNVRFPVPVLQAVKAQSGSTVYVRGPIRVDMSFKKALVRRPVLKVACLCDVGGELTCYSGLWDKLNTNARLSSSDVAASFKQAGIELPAKEREAAYADPKRVSEVLCGEVSKDKYAGATYGGAAKNGGFFRIGSSATPPRLLLWRLEVWQNGVLVGAYDSSRTGLGKYDVPADWHAWRKYPQRFKYVDR